jgi:hypothetical protein
VNDPVADLVLEEPAEQVALLAAALEDGSVTLEATRSRLKLVFTHGPRSLDRMSAVLERWRAAGGTEALLASTLRGQLEIRRTIENQGPRCELVWTGDTPIGASVRSTFPVVREMLTLARRSVLVVAYSLWIGTGDAGSVIDLLAERSSEGIDIAFVLDRRYQDGWNLTQLRQRWPEGRRRPSLYAWQDANDDIAKLHAKVLVVDRHDLLITSANLTGHGMRHNLEFGLRVLGRPAEDAAEHLDGLIRADVFKKVAW